MLSWGQNKGELMNRSIFKAFAVYAVAAVALTGCATSPANQEKQALLQQTIPVCNGEEDCTAKWEAAQLWIVHNAGYKLQTVTNVLLETYNPGEYETRLAVRATKEPAGNGTYKILVKTWCNNMFGCSPNQTDAALDFNLKVGAATP